MATLATKHRPVRKGEEAAAWGWYAVTVIPEPTGGGGAAGLVSRSQVMRAFYAVWWTGDPRLVAGGPPDPDEFGFVEGARPMDLAIGASYDALRKGRGRHVYDVCIGERFALGAYREGAPRKTSKATDFDAVAATFRARLGLTAEATPAEVKKAWHAFLHTAHPDKLAAIPVDQRPKIDMDDARKSYDATLAYAERLASEKARAVVAKTGAAPVAQGSLVHKIRKVARRVREACELLFSPLDIFGHDCASLAGYCVAAAIGLARALREVDIRADIAGGLVSGLPHWWAVIPTEGSTIIADVTATQFWPTARVVVAEPGTARAAKYVPWTHATRAEYNAHLAPRDLQVLLDGLPPAWWNGDVPMTTEDQRALSAAVQAAKLDPNPSTVPMARFVRSKLK